MAATHNKPLADAGLTSYRYKGSYGWIMIGAKDIKYAMIEVCRSMDGFVMIKQLQVWNGNQYVPA